MRPVYRAAQRMFAPSPYRCSSFLYSWYFAWLFTVPAKDDVDNQRLRVAAASPVRVKIVREVVSRAGFTVYTRRWVVGRFFAWTNRNRRFPNKLRPPPPQPKRCITRPGSFAQGVPDA